MQQHTSISAYHELHNKEIDKELVYNAIKKFGKAYDRQIAKALGWEPSTVSARRNELIRDGLVESAGFAMSITRKVVKTWRVTGLFKTN